jgi:hypothetical protein
MSDVVLPERVGPSARQLRCAPDHTHALLLRPIMIPEDASFMFHNGHKTRNA